MLRAALVFFVLGLVFLLLGAVGVAGISMDIAHGMSGVFMVLAFVSVVSGATSRRRRA